MTDKEQKLQAHFLQFVTAVADMRRKQKQIDKYPVHTMQQAQHDVDVCLHEMGITDQTDLNSLIQKEFVFKT